MRWRELDAGRQEALALDALDLAQLSLVMTVLLYDPLPDWHCPLGQALRWKPEW